MTAERTTPAAARAGSSLPPRLDKPRLLRQFAAPILIMCIGIAAGVVLFSVVRNWKQSRARRDFEGFAQERVSALESHMQLNMRSLDTIKAFFLGSEKVERREFHAFAGILQDPKTDRQVLGWIARVLGNERQAYERARQNEGLEGFRITQWLKDDQPVVAPQREEHFPVHFAEPQEDGHTMLGLDLTSNPACLAAMAQARDTGVMTATALLNLGGEKAGQQSIVIFLPVYKKAAPTISAEERRRNLAGFVFGRYGVDEIMNNAAGPLAPQGVDLLVLDLSASPGGQFLAVHWSRLKEPPADAHLPTPDNWREGNLGTATTFNVAGRSWQVLCKPTEGFVAERTTWTPWLGLLSVWGLTCLLAAYLVTIRTRRNRIEALAVELSGSNESLLMEMHERESAEQALRESEKRYRTMFESASACILIADADRAMFRYANPAICEMLDFTEDELTQMGVRDIHPRGELDRILLSFRAQARGEVKRVTNVPCLRKDGSVFYADISTARIVIDGRPCVIGFFTDITERRQAEDALAEGEKRYRQLVESLNEGILAMDRNGMITFVNTRLTEIIGDSAEVLLGSDFFGSTNAFQREAFRRSFTAQRDGASDVFQLKFLRSDGQLLYLGLQGSPIIDDDGNHIGSLAVINDITKRRQAEESLKAAHRQLMYAGEQERYALARDMHDSIGQQTIAMHLAIEDLLTKAKRAGDAYVEELTRLSQTCQSLTKEIRNASHGLFPPTLETFGLCSALRQLLRDCEHGIKVKMTCREHYQDIRFEPDIEITLFRIAQEAVSNVLRHGKAKHLEIQLDLDDGNVVMTVSDDGVDFDVEKAESTGLGLLTMRQRANAMGGSISISSQPGRTSIVARIPTGGEEEES